MPDDPYDNNTVTTVTTVALLSHLHLHMHMTDIPGDLPHGQRKPDHHPGDQVPHDNDPGRHHQHHHLPRCPRHNTPTSRTGTNPHPAQTSSPANAATGITPSTPGRTTAKPSSHTPCSTRDTFVRAPASIFAALRTITAVIGNAPSTPHTAFPTPCATNSRS